MGADRRGGFPGPSDKEAVTMWRCPEAISAIATTVVDFPSCPENAR